MEVQNLIQPLHTGHNIMHKVTRHNDDAIITPKKTIHLVIDIKLLNVPTDAQIDNAMTAVYPTLQDVGALAVQVNQKIE